MSRILFLWFQNFIFLTDHLNQELEVYDIRTLRHEVSFGTGTAKPAEVIMYDKQSVVTSGEKKVGPWAPDISITFLGTILVDLAMKPLQDSKLKFLCFLEEPVSWFRHTKIWLSHHQPCLQIADECSVQNCSDGCIAQQGQAECYCTEDRVLQADGLTCVGGNLFIPRIKPWNSTPCMKCEPIQYIYLQLMKFIIHLKSSTP